MTPSRTPRVIAFHLPQYHPIPENDSWWGRGFTEWTNVTKARPLFPGHYQPHLPSDLGFYDLRLPETRLAQAELAKGYGVDGFCYYHYWFNGKRLLNRPVNEIVSSGSPDFPFCLCWANENWTRAWDGGSHQVLLEQHYSESDDRAHIEHLLPTLADPRYIRVGGKPLLLIYRTELLPNPARTADLWRTSAINAGLGDLFLARVESFRSDIDPATIGFDAAVEFAPDWRVARLSRSHRLKRALAKLVGINKELFSYRQGSYPELVRTMLQKPSPPFRRYRCVTPGWDNTARRSNNAVIFSDGTPHEYSRWLKTIARVESASPKPDNEKLIFINAWNEWAEGNHLEPDQHWGRAYLEATLEAIHDTGIPLGESFVYFKDL